MSGEIGGPAVVLRKVDYGDSDAVVTFLTRDHGRIGAFVKGARRRKSPRFPGAIEPFTLIDARFRRRSAGADLWSLTVADVVDGHAGLRKDLSRIGWASYAAEVARELSRERDDSGALFRIVVGQLQALAERGAVAEDQAAFELAALAAAGFAPRLDRCGTCGQGVGGGGPHRWVMSWSFGGLACAPCSREGPLSAGAVASLRAVAGVIPPDRPRVRFGEAIGAELEGVMADYVEGALGKTLKTRSFLTSMGRF